MKKLLLLFALFIFACSSDDSSDDNNEFREYLNSNIFSSEYEECVTIMIFPPIPCGDEFMTEQFVKFTLNNNSGVGWNFTTFKNYPYDCGNDINTSQCYYEENSGEGIIVFETEDVIIWERTFDGQLFAINRNGDSISIIYLNLGAYEINNLSSLPYNISNQENLNLRISERGDFICPSGCLW